jgi:hypothetical protein
VPEGVFTPLTLTRGLHKSFPERGLGNAAGVFAPDPVPYCGYRFRIGVDMMGGLGCVLSTSPRSGVTVVNLSRSLPPGPRHLSARATS